MRITSWVITIPMRALSMRIEIVEEGVIKSRFDFNADGFGDSLLEVRFSCRCISSEVGFGDPYEDPYKDLNKENMGSIYGSVLG